MLCGQTQPFPTGDVDRPGANVDVQRIDHVLMSVIGDLDAR